MSKPKKQLLLKIRKASWVTSIHAANIHKRVPTASLDRADLQMLLDTLYFLEEASSNLHCLYHQKKEIKK